MRQGIHLIELHHQGLHSSIMPSVLRDSPTSLHPIPLAYVAETARLKWPVSVRPLEVAYDGSFGPVAAGANKLTGGRSRDPERSVANGGSGHPIGLFPAGSGSHSI
jgi:hypothetical protein